MDSLENVDKVLQEIEKKYSTNVEYDSPQTDLEEQLHILSKEFETLGLPTIDRKQNKTKLLDAVVNNSLLLVHLYRKMLSQMTEMGICHRAKDIKNTDLEKNIQHLKVKLKMAQDQNLKLEAKLNKVTSDCLELKKKVSLYNSETDKIKHYHKSKQNELVHLTNSLKSENQHLKEMCGKDIDKYLSKDDKFLQIVKKYKHNEEAYKSALQKMEENNMELMNEVLNLKKDLALAYLKNE